jgi:hypothetical protein
MSCRIDLIEKIARAQRFAVAVTRSDDKARFEAVICELRVELAAIDSLPSPVKPV